MGMKAKENLTYIHDVFWMAIQLSVEICQYLIFLASMMYSSKILHQFCSQILEENCMLLAQG